MDSRPKLMTWHSTERRQHCGIAAVCNVQCAAWSIAAVWSWTNYWAGVPQAMDSRVARQTSGLYQPALTPTVAPPTISLHQHRFQKQKTHTAKLIEESAFSLQIFKFSNRNRNIVMYKRNLPVKWNFFSPSLFFSPASYLIAFQCSAVRARHSDAPSVLPAWSASYDGSSTPIALPPTLRCGISPPAAVQACLKEHAAGCRQAGPSMSILSGNQFLCPVAAKCPHFLCLVHCPLHRA